MALGLGRLRFVAVCMGWLAFDVHVKRLREALSSVQCAHLVETVRGAGYRLTQRVGALQA